MTLLRSRFGNCSAKEFLSFYQVRRHFSLGQLPKSLQVCEGLQTIVTGKEDTPVVSGLTDGNVSEKAKDRLRKFYQRWAPGSKIARLVSVRVLIIELQIRFRASRGDVTHEGCWSLCYFHCSSHGSSSILAKRNKQNQGLNLVVNFGFFSTALRLLGCVFGGMMGMQFRQTQFCVTSQQTRQW